MDPGTISAVISGVCALSSLFGRKKSKAEILAEQAAEMNMRRQKDFDSRYLSNWDRLNAFANRYDPAAEDKYAIDQASRETQATIENAMRNLNAQFRAGGGSPTGDSEFNVRAKGMTNRAADPLRQLAAQLAASRSQRKYAMLQAAMGAPLGSLSESALGAAQILQNQGAMNAQNAAGAANVLAGSVDQILSKGKDSKSWVKRVNWGSIGR